MEKLPREKVHQMLMANMQNTSLSVLNALMNEAKKTRANLQWEDIGRLQLAAQMFMQVHKLLTDPTCVQFVHVKVDEHGNPVEAVKEQEKQSVEPINLSDEQQEKFNLYFGQALSYIKDHLGLEAVEQAQASDFVESFLHGTPAVDAIYEVLLNKH